MVTTTTSSTGDANITYTYGGFDPFFINWKRINSAFDDIFRTTQDKFPAYNIRKVADNRVVIELAVAGYSEGDLDIEVNGNSLIITGEKPDDGEFLHKGIASRKFTKTFVLGDYMETTGVHLTNGILYIGVVRNIPEEKMPKKLEIATGKPIIEHHKPLANAKRKRLI